MRTPAQRLAVGGIEPFTTIDFPGHLSAVIFCQGCPWRCTYCHNAHLQPFGGESIPWPEVLSFLENRIGFLEAVVFSGGEPTAQSALPTAIHEVREMGFLIGLHTAGMFPETLARILPTLDWVGLDIKAPFDTRHDTLTQKPDSWQAVKESLRHVVASGVKYQLRTTRDPTHLDEAACKAIDKQLDSMGAQPTTWQTWREPVAVASGVF
ncbi:MAG: anaerobic ribonucleoside-triphosphate reductase activating protein [Chthoniobacterales bacterium]